MSSVILISLFMFLFSIFTFHEVLNIIICSIVCVLTFFNWIVYYNVETSLFVVEFIFYVAFYLCYWRWTKIMFSCCLFVCLWVGYLKKLRTDSDKTWWTGWFGDKDELNPFRWRSGSENFLSDSSPLSDGATTIYIAWYDSDKICWMSWIGDKSKPVRFWLSSGCKSALSVGYKR